MRTVVWLAVLITCSTSPLVEARPRGDHSGDDAQVTTATPASVDQQLEAIRKELAEIRRLLEERRAPQPASPALPREPLSITDAPAKGRRDAPLAIIEFADFECPYCGRYARETLPMLDREYIATGKLVYVFRHLPLAQLHPHAFNAAVVATCAARQGRFWEMHEQLIMHQTSLTDDDLLTRARVVGLALAPFNDCRISDGPTRVRADLHAAESLGLSGTPTLLLGTTDPDGRVRVRRIVTGAVPHFALTAMLSTLDPSQGPTP